MWPSRALKLASPALGYPPRTEPDTPTAPRASSPGIASERNTLTCDQVYILTVEYDHARDYASLFNAETSLHTRNKTS